VGDGGLGRGNVCVFVTGHPEGKNNFVDKGIEGKIILELNVRERFDLGSFGSE
jgi:hypothetical protein